MTKALLACIVMWGERGKGVKEGTGLRGGRGVRGGGTDPNCTIVLLYTLTAYIWYNSYRELVLQIFLPAFYSTSSPCERGK
jgi:hypothetical protein